MNKYEMRQAARKERYEELAESFQNQSMNALDKAEKMASAIPFGQPILVGHHSEKQDRNYRKKINHNFDKSHELMDKSKYYAQKAADVGKGGISSDDPDALLKLNKKLNHAMENQEFMKQANRLIRKNDHEALRTIGLKFGIVEDRINILLKPDFMGNLGFPAYALTNNNANIRRLKLRIAELEGKAKCQTIEQATETYCYREDVEENRILFIFNGKPNEAIRNILKSQRFRWSPSRTAWIRQLNNAGRWAAKYVREALDHSTTD